MKKKHFGYLVALLSIPIGIYLLYWGDLIKGIGIFIIGITQAIMTKYFPNGILNTK